MAVSGRSRLQVEADADPVHAIDPRVRARKDSVEDIERRRRRRRRLVRFGIPASILAVLLVLVSPLASIRTVTVKGLSGERYTDVVEVARKEKGRPAILVDSGAVKRRIDAIPGISDVEVTVQWPWAMTVVATGLEPVAYAATSSGGVAGIDAEGRVVELFDAVPDDLVRLEGATVDNAVGSSAPDEFLDALAVAGALSPRLISNVTAVRTDRKTGVNLDLEPSGYVVVGSTEDLADKLRAAETLLSGKVVLDCLDRVDVRVPTAATVTRDPKCTGQVSAGT